MIEKKTLRGKLSARRAEVHGTVDPVPALDHLRSALKGATYPVSFYWPIRSEIDPRPVMEECAGAGEVCLPVTVGFSPLSFRRWTPGAAMESDGFGVSVPRNNDECEPRTLVVPLLGFDPFGHRLGYGAGHYDRTLQKLRAKGPVLAIGIAYSKQECAFLPTESTDQVMDMIVTEKGILIPG